MHRLLTRITPIALLASLATLGCSAHTIVDDWGPPAGFARLVGTVTDSAGAPIRDAEVLVSRCSSPVGGLLGSTRTDADGRYRPTGALAPVGAFPGDPDNVRVHCAALVDRSPVLDSVEVRFAADSLAQAPQVVDLTVR